MTKSARLTLLDQFQCLADKCPDNCCHQWITHVDKDTVAKWREIKKPARRDLLLSTMQPVSQDAEDMVLMRKENGHCVHLDEQGLCEIQRQFSHDYLPLSCQSYPRDTVHKNTLSFQTAHLSCPGVISLLQQIPAEKLVCDEASLYQNQNLDIISQLSCAIYKYMQNIFSIKGIYLGLKVFALSRVIAEIMQLALEDTLTSDLLHSRYHVSADNLAQQWMSWQKQSHTQEFDDSKEQIRNFLQKINTGLLAKYKEGLEGSFGIKIPSLSLSRFFKWRTKVDIALYEPLIEKYLRIKFLNNGFPWNPTQNNHAATFMECIIALLIIHHILFAHDDAGMPVDDNLLRKIIYTVERVNGHNDDNIKLIGQKPELLDLNQYNMIFTLFV